MGGKNNYIIIAHPYDQDKRTVCAFKMLKGNSDDDCTEKLAVKSKLPSSRPYHLPQRSLREMESKRKEKRSHY